MKCHTQELKLPVASALMCWLLAAIPAAAAPNAANAAIPSARLGGVNWNVTVPNDGVSLRVSMPDGSVFEQAFARGQAPWFSPKGGALPDGAYVYELVMSPVVSPQERALAQSARDGGQSAGLPSGVVESGVFRVLDGVVVLPDPSVVEPRSPAAAAKAAPPQTGHGVSLKDFFINDDVIAVGSICAGFDCVNNEVFGLENIKLKQNNNRIQFDDTSTATGFPANDWQLRANDDSSGGANKFSIEDLSGAKLPFTITAGAPSNSLFVDSSGRTGLGTATPSMKLHLALGDTPTLRLEQNNSGGFTPQTWDVGGNESTFFVRDATGGNTMPFRIRPGAPSSSIDILGTGNVGIGTGAPAGKLHVFGTGTQLSIFESSSGDAVQFRLKTDSTNRRFVALNSSGVQSQILFGNNGAFDFFGPTNADKRLSIPAGGVLNCGAGIKTDANGLLSCIVSSRQFKTVEGDLAPLAALTNVMALRPQVGSYKATPNEPEHWLIAEDVAAVDPALVGMRDGKPYTVKTQNIIADLVAVIQEQQHRIEALERRIAEQRE